MKYDRGESKSLTTNNVHRAESEENTTKQEISDLTPRKILRRKEEKKKAIERNSSKQTEPW